MDGCLPITKSFLADSALCPWKAWQHKALRVPSVSSPAAKIGTECHKLTAEIMKGEETLSGMTKKASTLEVAELATRAVGMMRATPPGHSDKIEQWFGVDNAGRPVGNREGAACHGFIDRVLLSDPYGLNPHIEELKFGRQGSDFEAERHIYVKLIKAHGVPNLSWVSFNRIWVRQGKVDRFVYRFSGPRVVVYHKGTEIGRWSGKPDALMEYILDAIQVVKDTPPTPTPGDHCESWYGEPCQFLGTECPLAEKVPAVTVANIDNRAEVGKALALVLKGIPLDQIDKTTAELATTGLLQMKGLLKMGEGRIAERSKALGPLSVGNAQYGWHQRTKMEVDDKVWALQTMLDTMPIEYVAKAVNIGKTSLGKISKKKYGSLRKALLGLALSYVRERPVFGKLPKEEK